MTSEVGPQGVAHGVSKPPATASVIIPAHNEAAVIGRLLTSLATQKCAHHLEVWVVANGCTDDTVAVAASFEGRLPGLAVVDLDRAGKANALKVGDEQARAFPRIYIDADIELTPGTLDELIASLDVDAPRVATPTVRFDDSRASTLVRAFYRVFRELPYVTSGLIGLGVYGLSAQGRERFAGFTSVTADDLFVQRLFSPAERLESTGAFIVRTPQTIAALVKVRTRVAVGNAELANLASAADSKVDVRGTTWLTLRALVGLIRRRPASLLDALVYMCVVAAGRLFARTAEPGSWQRDETSRR